MKRVLVITYYWPPSGGAGVQRWLKFSKYLPEFGWQPVIYTPSNPEAPLDDPSLLKDIPLEAEVIKRTIWEPYSLYKRFVGMGTGERINSGFLSEGEKPPGKEGFSVWIRGNLFIPDARKYWIRPSVRFLKNYLKQYPVDAIISTGPPHSMHLIALRLHRDLGIPWISDFRDPWTEIDFYDQLRLSRWADRKHHSLERKVLLGANRVVVVGKTMAARLKEKTGIDPEVITNGYDEADFLTEGAAVPDSSHAYSAVPFTLVHVGAMNRDRNHPAFWRAMAELRQQDPDLAKTLRIVLVGKLDYSVKQSIEDNQLNDCVKTIPSLPHEEIIPLLKSASVLYLPINRTPNAQSIATGKLFEYLSARRPILGTGPTDGDAATILKECQSGEMLGFDDQEGIVDILVKWHRKLQEGKLTGGSVSIDQYSRKSLTYRYVELLNQIITSI